jgi:hypothetical protein
MADDGQRINLRHTRETNPVSTYDDEGGGALFRNAKKQPGDNRTSAAPNSKNCNNDKPEE